MAGPQRGKPMTLKGLQDMRKTAAAVGGRGDALPHQIHMRLCALEMERSRRDQERQVCLARAARCEDRCRLIDTEVRALMEALSGTALPVRRGAIVEPKGHAAKPDFVHRY